MNRIGGALLATAAVIGIVAGGYAGITIGRPTDDGKQPERSPTDTQPDSPAEERRFFATPEEIHDTGMIVPLTALADRADRIVSLERLPGGNAWLLILSTSDDVSTYEAVRVDQKGTVKPLGDFAGVWDLSESADQLIAMTVDASAYVVRSTLDGTEIDRVTSADVKQEAAAGVAAFSATGVVTAWTPPGSDRTKMFETELGVHLSDPVGTDFYDWSASPAGVYLAGEKAEDPANPDGERCLQGGPLGNPSGWWKICGSLASSRFGARFSPDGARLLAVAADKSDTSYAVFNAEDGSGGTGFEVPAGTRAAEWWDNNRFIVVSGEESGPQVLSECTVDTGVCEEFDRIDADIVVLGTPGAES